MAKYLKINPSVPDVKLSNAARRWLRYFFLVFIDLVIDRLEQEVGDNPSSEVARSRKSNREIVLDMIELWILPDSETPTSFSQACLALNTRRIKSYYPTSGADLGARFSELLICETKSMTRDLGGEVEWLLAEERLEVGFLLTYDPESKKINVRPEVPRIVEALQENCRGLAQRILQSIA